MNALILVAGILSGMKIVATETAYRLLTNLPEGVFNGKKEVVLLAPIDGYTEMEDLVVWAREHGYEMLVVAEKRPNEERVDFHTFCEVMGRLIPVNDFVYPRASYLFTKMT